MGKTRSFSGRTPIHVGGAFDSVLTAPADAFGLNGRRVGSAILCRG